MADGDEAALAALDDHASALVHGLTFRILRDESAAEDVTAATAHDVTHTEGGCELLLVSSAVELLT